MRLVRALGARWPDAGGGGPAGPAWPRPNASVPQPHWKNAVSTPNEAAEASRFITAAVAGISRLRNATTSSRKLSPMMVRMNHGSFATTTAAKSAKVALVVLAYQAGLPGAHLPDT